MPFIPATVSFGERGFCAGLRRCGVDLRRAAGRRDHGRWARRAHRRPPWRPWACRWHPAITASEQSPQRLCAEAQRVGFPLIIKASAGGGGKGMQVVNSAAEVAAAVESAQRLARTAFGDDRLLLERYFPGAARGSADIRRFPRRIVSFSIAIARCSAGIKRSSRKRRRRACAMRCAPRMAQAAIQAARAVGYVGAGTVEFLVDRGAEFLLHGDEYPPAGGASGHGVITGIDLVEWQLRIAQGERLPQRQQEIAQHGVAIEARLYAEDPAHGYLPSVGRIAHLRWPDAAPGLRLDTGVDAGDEVSTFYDPMLGKVIAWGESRGAAADRCCATRSMRSRSWA